MTVSPLEALAAIAESLSIPHVAVRTAGISDDPRHAAFAREWGVDSPRKMFMFLQNQGFGSLWRSRGERYRHSQLRTSIFFFPLPPQKGVVT
jgi:steroid 5-alpha reductase family enzyme